MRFAALILVPSLAASSLAFGGPTRLTAKQLESTNLHIANEDGAINWFADATVTLDLGANRKVVAIGTGKRVEHNLWAHHGVTSDNTDDTRTWKTTWHGTYSISNGVLALDLVLDKDDCKAARTSDRYAAEPLTCEAASPRAQLTCTTETLEVSDSPSTAKPQPPAKLEAWMCATTTTASLGESTSWVFGKQACIATISGHMMTTGNSYERCAP